MHSKRIFAALGLSCAFAVGVPLGMAHAAAPTGTNVPSPPASQECVTVCYPIWGWFCQAPPWGGPDDCVYVYKQLCVCK